MTTNVDRQQTPARATLDGSTLFCSGLWTVFQLQQVERTLADLHWPKTEGILFDMQAITGLDTSGAWLLYRTAYRLGQAGQPVTVRGLTPHAQDLYQYVSTRGGAPGKGPKLHRAGMVERLGRTAVARFGKDAALLAFVGETAVAAAALLLAPRRIRWRTILRELGAAGYKALGIVGMLAFLLGVVIAYQGGVQLETYGANIYIADLVGLSMIRELSPLIAAIVAAGRTGSAYTAQIGTMKVTEEINALRTIAIAPMELLVIPKLIALMVALPLLTVYADIMGVFGGMVMASSMLGVSAPTFIDRLGEAISLQSYLTGVGKAPVFAAIIATIGCFQGFQVTGSAESVGRHTTLSVVQAIFWVIVVDAAFSVIFSRLGI